MTSTFDKVVFAVALLILLPVILVPGGFLFALTVAVLWILLAYGIKTGIGIEKERRKGERGERAKINAEIEKRREG